MKKQFAVMLICILCLGLLAGCGATSYSAAVATNAWNDSADMAFQETMVSNSASAPNASGLSLPEGRKWIITVETDAETDDLDKTLETLSAAVTEQGGYMEHQQIENGSSYASRRYRYADLTIRIPAENLDAFLAELSHMSNVVSSSRSAEDATLTYVDTQSRVKALEAERDRLLELLAQAEDMSDLLTIEERLTDVRYELERYESNLRSLDNQIDYATVYLNISQVTEYTPVAEKTFWQRISAGFTVNLKALWDGIQDCIVWLLSALPFLIPLGLLTWGIVVLCRRSAKKRKEKRIAAWQAQQSQKKQE